MVTTRSKRRASKSSNSSIASFATARTTANTMIVGSKTKEDGYTAVTRKRLKTHLPTEKSLERVPPSVEQLNEIGDDELIDIVARATEWICCTKCGSRGNMKPVGKAGNSEARRWKCGPKLTDEGCKSTCFQVVIVASALGIPNPSRWSVKAPLNLKRRLNELLITMADTKAQHKVSKVRKEVPKSQAQGERSGSEINRTLDLAEETILEKLKSETQKDTAKIVLEAVRAAFKTLMPEGQAEKVEKAPQKAIKAKPCPKESYASKTAKGLNNKTSTRWARPTVKELEGEMPEDKRIGLGMKFLQWTPPAPINKRLIKTGEALREGPLKKRVEETQFVYVAGITRQPYGKIRSGFRAIGVETSKVVDISFVGKKVCGLLVTTDYIPELEKKLSQKGGENIAILKEFDPLSSEHTKRPPGPNGNIKTPAELFVKRAAFATANSGSLLVATKYQEKIPEELQARFREELDKIMDKKTEVAKAKKTSKKTDSKEKK